MPDRWPRRQRRAEEVAPRVAHQAADRMAPLAPSKVARVVMVPLPAASSKTVPSPLAPPSAVVPKRLPRGSRTRPANGKAPLAPLKEARVVMVPLPAASSKTVPHCWPRRTPSCRRGCPAGRAPGRPAGKAPLSPLNEARVVIVPLPAASSKTVPSPLAPPPCVVPKRLPRGSRTRPPAARPRWCR